jgi:uncharacterized repeat protein (TIGR01451 family)
LGLTKTATGYIDNDADGTLSPGDTVVYQLDWSNTGNADATGAVLTDDPDETYVASIGAISDGGIYDGLTISWTIGTVTASASGTVTYSATLQAAGTFADGTTAVVNTVVLTSTEDGPETDTETVTVTATADLSVVKGLDSSESVTATFANLASASSDEGVSATSNTVSNTVTVTTRLTRTLTISNPGDATATNVTLSDTLPAGTTFESATGGGLESLGTVSWSLGSLAPGASTTVSVTVTTD